MSKKSELPPGWLEVEFGDLFSLPGDDIVDGPFGSNLKASEYVNEGIPIARLQNIDRNQFVAKNTKYVTREKAEELARHTFVPGDILITKLGDPLGKACLAPANIDKGVLVADVVRARITHPWVDRRFLCYQINADNIVEQFKEQTKGTTRPRVNLTKIRALRARLCPLPEQIRIITKLEELLTDLDAGVVELIAAQEKLAQHRQSLLKAAVDGSLTIQWRAERARCGEAVETGAQLLARILAERRTRWNAEQLAKFERQDKIPPQGWQDKYPEPVQPDTTDLPALPDGWVWASISQLGSVQLGRQRSPDKLNGLNPIRYIRAANITEHGVDFTDVLEMDFNERERATFELKPGDVLLTEASGSPEHVGRPAIWPKVEGLYCFQNTVIRFTPHSISSDYAFHIFLAWQKLGKFQQLSGGVGINHLSAGKFSSMAIPLPPLIEQIEIVNTLAHAVATMAEQELAIGHSLKQSTDQRKSLLKAAFSGQLVPQNSIDEHASVLLEQIFTEREAREKQPKIKKAGKDSGMKTFDVNSLREWFKNQSGEQISFEELRSAIPRDYEMLKDFVFQLLDESNPIIEQEFNQKTGRMSFKRVKP